MGPVTGGLRGMPWAGTVEALAPLAPFDFVQEEFFFTGTAYSRDNMALATGSSAAYTSRMLVQRPRNPEEFNGTVLVEWLNVTTEAELPAVWALTHKELLREGYAYVAISAQEAGVSVGPLALKLWDPVRYAPLSHPGDAYEFDIFAQAGQALLNETGVQPLGELKPRRIIGSGASQSASLLLSYINNLHREQQLFDGFFVYVWSGPVDPGVDVPVMMVLTESELEGFTSPLSLQGQIPDGVDNLGQIPGLGIARIVPPLFPSADSDNLRVWEMAGATHVDQQGLTYLLATLEQGEVAPLDLPPLLVDVPLLCLLPINRLDASRPTMAALHQLDQWIRSGRPPAHYPRANRNDDDSLIRDADGIAQGGIRMPPLQAPIGANRGDTCAFFGSYQAFNANKIQSLYPDAESYRLAVTEAALQNVDEGTLLPPEAEAYIQEAYQVDVW